jgi:di/tripeptidase
MQDMFEKTVEAFRAMGVEVEVEKIGDRPCSGELDERRFEALKDRAKNACKEIMGVEMTERSGSTDCNIPLSMNIPSLCYGFYNGQGAHTREEYIEISSLKIGYHVAFESILAYFE